MSWCTTFFGTRCIWFL